MQYYAMFKNITGSKGVTMGSEGLVSGMFVMLNSQHVVFAPPVLF
jgi:hypothetical protein